MPGIRALNDKEFIRSFQVMDRVIQNNEPIFMLVWVGSILSLIATIALGIGNLNNIDLLPVVFASAIYFLGVQLPTVTINIPLNNKIQTLDVNEMDEATLKKARQDFEPRWNKWNIIRSILASLTSILLIIILFKL